MKLTVYAVFPHVGNKNKQPGTDGPGILFEAACRRRHENQTVFKPLKRNVRGRAVKLRTREQSVC